MQFGLQRRTSRLVATFGLFTAAMMGQSLKSITCSTSIPAGSSGTCTVALTSKAPMSGVPVTITSTGTGVAVPAKITVPVFSTAVTFAISTTSSTPQQSLAIRATAGAVSFSAPVSITTAGSFQITDVQCTPTKVIPGSATKCRVTLSSSAPAGGVAVSLSSSVPAALSVPASMTIAAGSPLAEFTAASSRQVTVLQNVRVTARVASSSRYADVAVDPTPLFHLKGSTSELTSLANGTRVYASAAPAGLVGTLNLRGTGYVSFGTVSTGTGVSYRRGGAQNANSSFVNFAGSGFAGMFDTDGEISFTIKSGLTFAERKAQPSSAIQYAFDVYDDTAPQYHFMSYVTGTGALAFSYSARGMSTAYMVPAGQEDALFGRDVEARFRITWTSNTHALYINDRLVTTFSFATRPAVWGTASALTIGSRSIRYAGGGYYSSADLVSNFMVR